MERLDRPDAPLSGTELRARRPSSSRSTSARTTRPPTACCGCSSRSRASACATSSRSSATCTPASRRAARTSPYWKVITFVERMDYLAYYFNAMAFCMSRRAAARGGGARARPVAARDPHGAEPDRQPPVLARHLGARHRRDHDALVGLRDRELMLDLFEMSGGQRMHPRYFQVGGVMEDIPPGWEQKVPRASSSRCRSRIDQYEAVLDQQRDLPAAHDAASAIVSAERLLALGRHRPAAARGRATRGTCARRCPTRPTSSSTSRSRSARRATLRPLPVRLAEMRESLRIVEQALDGLPEGPYITDNRKVALPAAARAGHLMEALIHHFKLVTEGFRVPPGEAYVRDRVAARRARLLRGGRRLGQAGARAHARPALRATCSR